MNYKLQINNYSVLAVCLLLMYSCSEPTPRRPITRHTESVLAKSVELNKKINEVEVAAIKYYIALDSLKTYQVSPNGFWYTFINKETSEEVRPVLGNVVEFEYEILDLKNDIVYSKEEIGRQNYKIDKEDLESGLQNGIKLMKENEEVKFVFPSFKAFGFVGDQKKIKNNQPLVYKVKLIKINN